MSWSLACKCRTGCDKNADAVLPTAQYSTVSALSKEGNATETQAQTLAKKKKKEPREACEALPALELQSNLAFKVHPRIMRIIRLKT